MIFLQSNLMRIELRTVKLSVSGPETQSFSVQTSSKPKIPDKNLIFLAKLDRDLIFGQHLFACISDSETHTCSPNVFFHHK